MSQFIRVFRRLYKTKEARYPWDQRDLFGNIQDVRCRISHLKTAMTRWVQTVLAVSRAAKKLAISLEATDDILLSVSTEIEELCARSMRAFSDTQRSLDGILSSYQALDRLHRKTMANSIVLRRPKLLNQNKAQDHFQRQFTEKYEALEAQLQSLDVASEIRKFAFQQSKCLLKCQNLIAAPLNRSTAKKFVKMSRALSQEELRQEYTPGHGLPIPYGRRGSIGGLVLGTNPNKIASRELVSFLPFHTDDVVRGEKVYTDDEYSDSDTSGYASSESEELHFQSFFKANNTIKGYNDA